jgi:hypothetical protein
MKLFTLAQLSVHATINQTGFAQIEYKGIVSASSFAQARRVVMPWMCKQGAMGFVSLFEDVEIADWGAMDRSTSHSIFPGALFGSDLNMPVIQAYTAALRSSGFDRQAFTSRACAEAWLRGQAALLQEQEIWRASQVHP